AAPRLMAHEVPTDAMRLLSQCHVALMTARDRMGEAMETGEWSAYGKDQAELMYGKIEAIRDEVESLAYSSSRRVKTSTEVMGA
ncbi:MAG: hypothetical protein M3O82_01155, partial [Verrucomicrobiota bacterium]|nr:hypothetical protein [Verrucomicrobiota bacterium]